MTDAETGSFRPVRQAGLERLAAFLPLAGSDYAFRRNMDYGPENRSNISMLSPYVRHRLVLEEEIIKAVLGRHGFSSAFKFIQEVCWRTYWKGWLEMRPAIWRNYCAGVAELKAECNANAVLRKAYGKAVSGKTGIGAFDAWVRELNETSYLHNHARMWFASIWIFTLRLPWELGADFFFRHLIDGDPASNTLSWRWVAGLHSAGKTYLASADNIEICTGGRFRPHNEQLAQSAPALPFDGHPDPLPLPQPALPSATQRYVLLVTEEDCCPETLPFDPAQIAAVAVLDTAISYDADHSRTVLAFKRGAVEDAARRAAAFFGCSWKRISGEPLEPELKALLRDHRADAVAAAYIPVGPLRDQIAPIFDAMARQGLPVLQVRRGWDSAFWPYATKGYFKFRKKFLRS